MKKVFRSIIAILLVFASLAVINMSILGIAADNLHGQVYIQDVQMFQASDLDECEKLCRAVG